MGCNVSKNRTTVRTTYDYLNDPNWKPLIAPEIVIDEAWRFDELNKEKEKKNLEEQNAVVESKTVDTNENQKDLNQSEQKSSEPIELTLSHKDESQTKTSEQKETSVSNEDTKESSENDKNIQEIKSSKSDSRQNSQKNHKQYDSESSESRGTELASNLDIVSMRVNLSKETIEREPTIVSADAKNTPSETLSSVKEVLETKDAAVQPNHVEIENYTMVLESSAAELVPTPLIPDPLATNQNDSDLLDLMDFKVDNLISDALTEILLSSLNDESTFREALIAPNNNELNETNAQIV